jgi:hypothetical protein
MNRQRMGTRMAAVLLLAVAPVWAETQTQKDWRTHRSADYGFRIGYPRTMTFYPGGATRPPEKSMFPICDDETVACFEYNGRVFDRTQIQAVGLSVNLLREDTTEKGCANMQTESQPVRIKYLHGLRFYYGESADGGLGSGRTISAYRTFHRGSCFELALVTAQFDFSGQDMKDAGLSPAKPRMLRSIYAVMTRMLDSFAFSGPVQDAAGWNRFTGHRCGETFDYPESATVDSEAPSAVPVWNTWQLSCIDRFTYDQRQYTVAAKENLPNQEAVTAWLDSTRLPRLDEMQVVTRNSSLTEYRSPDFVYLVHGSNFYLVTVMDGGNDPLPIGQDGVLKRLLRSFRVQ